MFGTTRDTIFIPAEKNRERAALLSSNKRTSISKESNSFQGSINQSGVIFEFKILRNENISEWFYVKWKTSEIFLANISQSWNVSTCCKSERKKKTLISHTLKDPYANNKDEKNLCLYRTHDDESTKSVIKGLFSSPFDNVTRPFARILSL